jgi:hypothetical protein
VIKIIVYRKELNAACYLNLHGPESLGSPQLRLNGIPVCSQIDQPLWILLTQRQEYLKAGTQYNVLFVILKSG